jgi:hypothetical protein
VGTRGGIEKRNGGVVGQKTVSRRGMLDREIDAPAIGERVGRNRR